MTDQEEPTKTEEADPSTTCDLYKVATAQVAHKKDNKD